MVHIYKKIIIRYMYMDRKKDREQRKVLIVKDISRKNKNLQIYTVRIMIMKK